MLVTLIELQEDSGSIFESPWFWILGATVLAGGVTVAVLLAQVKRYDEADLDDPGTAGSRTPFELVLP